MPQYFKIVHVERFLEQYKTDIQQFLQTFREIELLDEKSNHLRSGTVSRRCIIAFQELPGPDHVATADRR